MFLARTAQSQGTKQAVTVGGLLAARNSIYATLYTEIGGQWYNNTYSYPTYQAATNLCGCDGKGRGLKSALFVGGALWRGLSRYEIRSSRRRNFDYIELAREK